MPLISNPSADQPKPEAPPASVSPAGIAVTVAVLPKPTRLNLEAFDEAPDEVPDAPELPPQDLDEASFAQAYDALLAELEGPKAVLHAALKAKRYVVEAHRWVHTATNRVEMARLQEELPGLVHRLRELTGNATLVMELRLDESLVPALRQQVRTREDLLEELMQRNPHLRTLVQRFGAGLEF